MKNSQIPWWLAVMAVTAAFAVSSCGGGGGSSGGTSTVSLSVVAVGK